MVQIRNIYILFAILIIQLVSFVSVVKAQDVTVKAKIDTSEFLIGDQVKLGFKVEQGKNEFVGIPVFNEKMSKQIEILEQSENDTTILENGNLLIEKELLITAFDSGYYAIPPIPFLYNNDTIFTEPVLFTVNTMPVDTSQAIKDIKMPYSAPLTFAEVMPWALGGLGLVLLTFIAIYVIRKIKRKEPIIKRFKPKEPAHIVAFRELDKLKNEKLWQQDKIKEYYTNLTDTIRYYLWNRYAIKTLERTSMEILESLKVSDFKDEEAFNILKDIFYTSDLVKFAKYKPIVDEHDKCFNGAYNFVDRTKLIVEEKVELEEVVETAAEMKIEEFKSPEDKGN